MKVKKVMDVMDMMDVMPQGCGPGPGYYEDPDWSPGFSLTWQIPFSAIFGTLEVLFRFASLRFEAKHSAAGGDMDDQEKSAVVAIFQEAQQMVEAGLGQSLSGSVARDQVLVNLIGYMVRDYFAARRPGGEEALARATSQALAGVSAPLARLVRPHRMDRTSLALALLHEAVRGSEGPISPQWVWGMFRFFLERTLSLSRGRAKG